MRHPPLPALLLAAVATAPSLGAQPPDDSPSPDARIARIERDLRPGARVRGRPIVRSTLEGRMRELGVPAVSVAVVEGGRVAWARAYGSADVATSRPATPATRFQAASISKPVAATAALQLVAEGALSLDDDVNRRLRSWRVPASPAANGQPVTLRQLLSHTAGLTVHGFPGYASGTATPTVVQILSGEAPANTRPVRVDTAPGGIWRYSGGGMTVMQLLMTDVTGKPFEQLLRERVLEPAGMEHSTYAQPLPAALADEAATGYRRGGAAVAGRFHTYPEQAAAGLWSTPTDLGRWVIAIQRAHAGAPGALVPRPIAEAMLTAGKGNWGLGPAVEGEGDARRFSHGGANEGFRAMVIGYLSGGRGIAVMTNSDVGAGVAGELIAAIAREYGWPGYAQREIVPLPIGAGALDSLAGRYADPAGRTFVASRDGGDLLVVAPGGQRYTLVAAGRDAFAFAHDGAPMRIERDAAGAVAALVVGGQRYPRQP